MSDREMYLGAMAGSYEGELPPPNTRSLKWMAKLLGQDVETEPVQSAEEAYLKAIYENGGGGVTVEALTVTANGRYAEEGKAYNPVLVEVPQVSGNPNYVETITGTLANPWGSVDPAALYAQMQNGEVSVALNITVPGEGQATLQPAPSSPMWWYSVVVEYDPDSHVVTRAMYLAYLVSGGLNLAYLYQNGTATDMSGMAAMFPTTLTIIHHPMTGALTPAESETFGGNA